MADGSLEVISDLSPQLIYGCTEESAGERTYLCDTWRYKSEPFIYGDCGRILVLPNSIYGWFGGFHRGTYTPSGAVAFGEAQLLTMQTCKDWLGLSPSFESVQCLVETVEADVSEPAIWPSDEAGVRVVGVVKPEWAVRLSEKSRILKSVLHPEVMGRNDMPWHPCTKQPAILSSHDPRFDKAKNLSPLANAVNEFRVPVEMSEVDLNIASEWVWAEWETYEKPSLCRLLTEEEAINGIPGMSYVEALDMRTSEGHPYVKWRPKTARGKEYLFENICGKWRMSDPRLIWRLKERLRCFKAGVLYPDSLWLDCLKDEKLKMEKIQNVRTRMFNVAPLELLILSKMYFGAFSKWFHETRTTSCSSPGINTRSLEWSRMFQYFNEVGTKGFWGDFKGWDKVMFASPIRFGGYLINRWYKTYDPNWKPEDDMIRNMILEECSAPYHLACNLIYQTESGLPSGYFLTAVMNCITNHMISICAFRDVVPNATFMMWRDCIRAKFYGDDNAFCVSNGLLDKFNGKALGDWFAARGITYTPADKASSWGDPEDIILMEYLKCHSRRISQDIVVPIISKTSINEALNWYHVEQGCSQLDGYNMTIMNVMEFLVFYGRKEYDRYRDALTKVLPERGIKGVMIPLFDESVSTLVKNGHFDRRLYCSSLEDPSKDLRGFTC